MHLQYPRASTATPLVGLVQWRHAFVTIMLFSYVEQDILSAFGYNLFTALIQYCNDVCYSHLCSQALVREQ